MPEVIWQEVYMIGDARADQYENSLKARLAIRAAQLSSHIIDKIAMA